MAELTPGVWTLDAAHTEIGFSVRHAAVSKTRGRFEEVESTVIVAENVAGSVVEASIKIDSLDTRNADRDGHLKSADFFDAEQHPAMNFKSTSFELADEATYGYAIIGALEAAGLGEIKGGALYPLLTRFEKRGLVRTKWRAGEGGPGRKYFSLTTDGRAELAQSREQWKFFSDRVSALLAEPIEQTYIAKEQS